MRIFMTGETNDAPGACKRTIFHSRSSSTEKAHKPSVVSSADNLLKPMVFTKLQHFKWTVKFETGQPLFKTQHCSADSVPGTWSPRTPSTSKKCLSVPHSRVRKAESEGPKYKANERELSDIFFAELVLYIEEARLDEETAQVSS